MACIDQITGVLVFSTPSLIDPFCCLVRVIFMSIWRTLIFVPADNPSLIRKVPEKGADAVILDLEDAVSSANKEKARGAVKDHISYLKSEGCSVCVRINSSPEHAVLDVEASLCEGLDAFMIPKVDYSDQLSEFENLLNATAGYGAARLKDVKLIPLVESAVAMPELFSIARAERVIGLAFGVEDFSHSMGVEPSLSVLELPSKMISLAAASRGLMSLAVPVSISDFSDVDRYRAAAESGKAYGVTGAICIHPKQVKVANEVFSPTIKQVTHAREVLATWQSQLDKGGALAVINGQMIDRPVVLRARNTLLMAGDKPPGLTELFPDSQ